MRDDKTVKHIITNSCCILSLSLALCSCEPESVAPEKLTAILNQNLHLREKISSLQRIISRSGDIDSNIPERIAQVESELATAIHKSSQLDGKKTDREIQLIDLEDRHKSLSEQFSKLQHEATTPAKAAVGSSDSSSILPSQP